MKTEIEIVGLREERFDRRGGKWITRYSDMGSGDG